MQLKHYTKELLLLAFLPLFTQLLLISIPHDEIKQSYMLWLSHPQFPSVPRAHTSLNEMCELCAEMLVAL